MRVPLRLEKVLASKLRSGGEELLRRNLWLCVIPEQRAVPSSFQQSEMCLHGRKPSTSPIRSLFSVRVVSDELSRVSFADENFQQSQFGFHVFVLVVLVCERGAVLLLDGSVKKRCGTNY